MARIPATYFDGTVAKGRDVRVEVSAEGIEIFDCSGARVATWDSERISYAGYRGAEHPVRLGLEGSTARLLIGGAEAEIVLQPLAVKLARRFRISLRRIFWTGAWIAVGLVAVVLFAWTVVPVLSEQLAKLTPETAKRRIGAAVHRQLADLTVFLDSGMEEQAFCVDPGGLRMLGRIAERINGDGDLERMPQVSVLNTSLVNAFALPGNFVVFTRGLIEYADDADEFAGVFAHELGHVTYDHPTRSVYEAAGISVLVSILIGDVTGGTLLGLGAEQIFNSTFSREDEREADQFAIRLLNQAGIEASGLGRLFRRRAAEHPETGNRLMGLLASHPPLQERLEVVGRSARSGTPALNSREWARLQEVCAKTSDQSLDPAPTGWTGASVRGSS